MYPLSGFKKNFTLLIKIWTLFIAPTSCPPQHAQLVLPIQYPLMGRGVQRHRNKPHG